VKLRNELQNVVVAAGHGRSVEGIVRVRGIDARVDGKGFVFEEQVPVGVVVRTHSGMQRITVPRYDAFPGIAVALAGPALYLAAKRFFRKGRKT
jgi:hypothetical protein